MISKARLELRPERTPFFCQWEVTCKCNLRCVMCYTDCFNAPEHIRRELPFSEIARIMDELHEAGCAEILFTGGEPFARPDFLEIHDRAKKLGFVTSIFSNGTMIDERIADRLAELPPSRVEISLHGVSAGVFEAVTAAPGSLEKCLRGLRLLKERGIPLVLKATAMTLNETELLAVKSFAREHGAAFKMGERMRETLDGDEAPRRFELRDETLNALEARDEDLAREARAREDAERPSCRGGAAKFHIDAYGVLQLCSGNRREGYDLTKGPFKTGFHERLPDFPCPNKR